MNRLHHAGLFRARVLCGAILLGIVSAVCGWAGSDAVGWNNKGVQYLNARNYPAAVDAFNQAVKIDPTLVIAWYHRGLAHYRSDKPARAVADLSRAIGLKPDDADAYLYRAHAQLRLNRTEDALKDYSEAIGLKPDDAYAYGSRGLVYSRMRKYAQAVADFSEAVARDPGSAVDYFNRGVTYQNMGDNVRALADYTAVIKLKPDHAKAYFYRSEANEALGHAAAAYADAKAAADRDPGNSAYTARLAGLSPPDGDSAKQQKTKKEARAAEPAKEIASSVQLHTTEGGYDDIAGYLYRRAARDYETWKQSGQAIHFHNALFHINSAVSIDPGNSEYWFFQGMLYAGLTSDPLYMAKAADSLIRAVEIDPGHGRAQLLLAQVLQEQGNFSLAVEQYRFLIEKDANMVTGLVLGPLALCFIADGQIEAGVHYFQTLAERYPASAPVKTALAVLMKQNSQIDLAKEQLERIIDRKLGPPREQAYARDLLAQWHKEGGR